MVGNLLEDLEELGLADLAITVFINGIDEGLDFLLGGLPAGVHVAEGGVDQIVDFLRVQRVASVGVELVEHGIHGFSQLLFTV